MKWIGLTGGIASGKSTVTQLLLSRGIPVIDADRIAKQVLEKGSAGLKSVIQNFGPEVLGSNGELNRAQLAELVFSNPEKLLLLENIVHPLVQSEVQKQRQWLQDQGTELAFYDVPLLFEKALQDHFDQIVLVSTSEENQRQRMKSRNQWSDEQIDQRLKSQLPMKEKEKRTHLILRNNSSLVDLEKQVDELIKVLSQ